MQELIDAVKAWPVIVQGALGSALFWLVLLIGQSLTTRITRNYSNHSKQARLSWLISEQAKCLAKASASHVEFAAFGTILIYRSSRHLLKAFMWLAMGLVFQSLFLPAGTIGFLGCLYYLFKAAEIVAPLDEEKHSVAELAKIAEEIKKLENA